MMSEQQRLIQLARESLRNKKRQIDEEIAELTRELRATRGKALAPAKAKANPGKRASFTREERLRRSQRMKTYWETWRKQKKTQQ